LAPLAPRPAIEVSPATGLVDRQQVTVTGTGFDPGAPADLSECVTAVGNCASTEFVVADGAGTFTTTIKLDAQLWLYGPVYDCRVADCILVARSYGPSIDVAVAPLAFDPDAPLAPPPEATATPTSDLVDMQVIQLEGTGFDFGYEYIGIPAAVAVPMLPVVPVGLDATRSLFDSPAPVAAAAVEKPGETYVQAFLCEGSDPSINRCGYDTIQSIETDDAGNLSGVFQVDATFQTYGGPVDCRAAGTNCELRVGQPGNPLRSASLSLQFDPDAPLAPPPVVSVTPTDDLLDGQSVTIVGDGLAINRPTLVSQCAVSGEFAGVCVGGTGVLVGTDGHMELQLQVQQSIPIIGPPVDCTAPGTCAIVVRDRNLETAATIGLSFRQPAPPPGPTSDPPASDPPSSDPVAVSPRTAAATRPSFTG
jgi:hypothetical protein